MLQTTAARCNASPHLRTAFANHMISVSINRRLSSVHRHAKSVSTGAKQQEPVYRRQLLTSLVGGSFGALLCTVGPTRGVAMAATGSEIEKVLEDPRWPKAWPFRPEQFLRYDESPDGLFYDQPRFVFHIDDAAVNALTNYYAEVLPPSGQKDVAILDLCSSWVSHYPKGYTAGRIVGLGMNKSELERNPQLTEFTVQDLNLNPKLPYDDNSFDVITNVVSVDYLNQPLEIFKEMHRVLKPGGTAIMSFSNRCFPTKAISIWTQTGDADHVWIVGSYFHYSVPGGYTEPKAKDISPPPGIFGRTDPMYVVYASKKA